VQAEDYIDPEEPIGPGEELISEMTTLEKAIYTVYARRSSDYLEYLKPILIRTFGNILEVSGKEMLKMMFFKEDLDFYQSFLLRIIRSRLKKKLSRNIVSVGVRNQFKVVLLGKTPKTIDDDCATCANKSFCDQIKSSNPDFCLN